MKGPEDFFKIVGIVEGEKLMVPLDKSGCHMPSLDAA
jgi:hypothetical protein